ncbi:hypothetical protein ACJMK2_031270 [Sinanodonta woodiana]|uniref:Uncharacterized protein n=1 Tax=Sinanodonta woodiana TaxID=1069815 RepID=A0ABD3WYA3_SINWO
MAEGGTDTLTIIFGHRINPDTDLGTTLQTSTPNFKVQSRSHLEEIEKLERECKALENQIQGNLTSLENEIRRSLGYGANAKLNRNFQKPLFRPATYDGSDPWEDFRVHLNLLQKLTTGPKIKKQCFWHQIYEEVHRQY